MQTLKANHKISQMVTFMYILIKNTNQNNLPNPGIKLKSPAVAGGFFATGPPRKPA